MRNDVLSQEGTHITKVEEDSTRRWHLQETAEHKRKMLRPKGELGKKNPLSQECAATAENKKRRGKRGPASGWEKGTDLGRGRN